MSTDYHSRIVIPMVAPELLRRTGHPACTADACESGTKPCPCPTACVLPEKDGTLRERLLRWLLGMERHTFWRLYLAVLIVSGCGFAAWMLPLINP